MVEAPEITQAFADELTRVALQQLRTSREYKQPRMARIKEAEDLYNGIVPKSLKNPFNESFPFMEGFVDHYLSRIDDPPRINFGYNDLADLIISRKITAAFANEVRQTNKRAKWALKDRWVKKNALFSGVGVYKFFAESPEGKYQSNFGSVHYYDFHCEPGGGGHLENHLFCGEDSIFKTKQQLLDGAQNGVYDELQVKDLIGMTSEETYKDNADQMDNKQNRERAFGMDSSTNNYVGETVFRFVEWYMEYKGFRWYLLFDEPSGKWVRVKLLKEILESNLWPYVAWHTHEDEKVFWSKAPCDAAVPVARYINNVLNQELYNREKQNHGQRAYDPQMYPDLESLASWRPDGLVPVDTKGGSRSIASGVYQFNVGGLNGTLDLVQFLDSFVGQKMGSTPGSQGAAEKDKKVGIYFGELNQIDEFIGTRNKSYKEAWAEIGMRYVYGLDENLDDEGIAVKLMGTKGAEWSTLSRKDMSSRTRELDVVVEGGNDAEERKIAESRDKMEALKIVQNVNPKWKDEQILRAAGYTDEEIKEAYSPNSASLELLSEAENAIQEILAGKTPKINRNANTAFMQKLIDDAADLRLKDDAKERAVAAKILDYAMSHSNIAAANEARDAMQLVQDQSKLSMLGGGDGAPEAPAAPSGPRAANPIQKQVINAVNP